MPVLNGTKYACEPCMRGHRSSKCAHQDRILIKVRRPGRPLSSCPHLPSQGPPGTTTFVDGNGAALGGGIGHGHGSGCGCEVTSLAIPKVSSCPCSAPTPNAAPAQVKINTAGIPKPLNTNPSQIAGLLHRVGSPPMSPTTIGHANGRIQKPSTKKKRMSVSISKETNLESVLLHNKPDQSEQSNDMEAEGVSQLSELGYMANGTAPGSIHNGGGAVYGNGAMRPPMGKDGVSDGLSSNGHLETHTNGDKTFAWEGIQGPQWQTFPQQLNSPNGLGMLNASQMPQTDIASQPSQTISPPSAPVKSCCGGCGSNKAPEPSFPIAPPLPQYNLQTPPVIPNFQPPIPYSYPGSNPPYIPYLEDPFRPTAMTIYTYPNGFTTVNHPLRPQELMELQARGEWLMSPAATAAWTGMPVNQLGMQNGMLASHACSCGPGCDCLGCAAHPFNTRTVNFVRGVRNVMYNDFGGRHPAQQLQREPQQQMLQLDGEEGRRVEGGGGGGCCSSRKNKEIPANENTDFTGTGSQQHRMYQQSASPSMNHRSHTNSPQLHPSTTNSSPGITNLHHSRVQSPSPLNNSSTSPIIPQHTASPSEFDEDDTAAEQNSISPSNFFHIDYPLGICSESDMGCLCGDSCTCVGCVVHGVGGTGNSISNANEAFNNSQRAEGNHDDGEVLKGVLTGVSDGDSVANGNSHSENCGKEPERHHHLDGANGDNDSSGLQPRTPHHHQHHHQHQLRHDLPTNTSPGSSNMPFIWT